MPSTTVGILRALLTADTTTFDTAMVSASEKTKAWSADFTRLGVSAQQLGETFTNSLTRSLTNVTNLAKEFSGAGIAKTADEYAAAIQRVGGVSRLTEAEQVKINGLMTEAIAKYQALGQTAPAHLMALREATQQAADGTKSFGDQLKAAIPSGESLVKQIQATALGYVTGTLALQGFEKAGRVVLDFVVDSVKAFAASEDAQRRMVTALEAQGLATPTVIHQFDELSKSYQRLTVNSAAAIKETESLLIQVGGVLPEQMDQALKATTDLAAGLGVDLRSATMLVAKAFEDNFTALKKAGVQIDETRAQAEGMEYVLGQIEKRFGGQARSEVQSYAGQIKQLGNEYDDLKEAIGAVVVNTGFLQVVMAVARAEITKMKGELQAVVVTAQVLAAIPGPLGEPFRALGFQLKAIGKDIVLPDEGAKSVAGYADQLAIARQHVAALTAEQRTNLAAGLALGTQTAELQKTFHLTAGEVKLFEDQLRQQKDELKKNQDALAKHQKQMEDWAGVVQRAVTTSWAQFIGKLGEATLAIPAHIVADKALAEAHADLGEEVTQAAIAMAHAGLSADEIFKKLKDGKQVTDAEKMSVENLTKGIQEWDRVMQSANKPLQELLKNFPTLRLAENALTVATAAVANAHRQLNPELTKSVQLWMSTGLSVDEAIKKIREHTFVSEADADAIRAQAKELTTLSAELQAAGNMFVQLAQIGGKTFGPVTKAVGEVTVAVGALSKAADDVTKKGLNPATFTATAAAAAGLFTVLVSIAQQMANDANEAAALTNHVRDLQAAAADFGPVSDAIGTSLRKNLDLLQQWAAAQGDAGLAMTILTKGLSDALVRAQAEALSLSQIIADMGGVTDATLPMIESRIDTLFQLIAGGGPPARAAIGQLNDVLKQMGDYFAANGGLWDAAFQSMIARAKDLGVNLSAINDLMAGQQSTLEKAIAGVTAQVGGQAKTYTALTTAVTEAQKAYDDLVKSGADQDQITAAAVTLKHAQEDVAHAAVTSQEEFNRLSRIALNAFNTLVASGKDPVTAMREIGGSIDDLIANAQAFGLSGNEAFDTLSRWRDLTQTNAPLLTELGSLNDLMVATANLGGLTASGFADMQAQGVAAFNQLTAAGFTQQEAELAEKPLLESIIKLHKDKGLAIDEATQKIIDQATQDGILGAQEESTNDVLREGLGALITVLGGDLPEAWRTAAQAGTDAAAKVTGNTGIAGVQQKQLDLQKQLKDKAAWDQWSQNAGTAAGDIQRHIDEIDTTVDVDVTYHETTTGSGPGGGQGGGHDGPDVWGRAADDPDWGKGPGSAAMEGFFPRPTLVHVGDAPGERGEYVLHASTVDRLLAAYQAASAPMPMAPSAIVPMDTLTPVPMGPLTLPPRGGGAGTVLVTLNGRLLAQAIVPEFEGAVRRLGFGR